MKSLKELKNFIDPHKTPEKQFYLDLLDGDKQRACEDEHIRAVLLVLKIVRIRSIKQRKKQFQSVYEKTTDFPLPFISFKVMNYFILRIGIGFICPVRKVNT